MIPINRYFINSMTLLACLWGMSFSPSLQALDPFLWDKAAFLCESASYEEAVEVYEKIMTSLNDEKTPESVKQLLQARLQLAHVYYILEQPQKIVELLTPTKDKEELYFVGIAFQKEKNYGQAIQVFRQYLSSMSPLKNYEAAHWEIGMALYHQNNLEEAKEHFQQIKKSHVYYYTLSQLSLARILILQKNDSEAEQVLLKLPPDLYNKKALSNTFKALLDEARINRSRLAEEFYIKGVNALEEALKQSSNDPTKAKSSFEQAAAYFQQTFDLYKTYDLKQAAITLRHHVQAYLGINSDASLLQAFHLLNQSLKDIPQNLEEMDELYNLKSWVAYQLYIQDKLPFEIAENTLKQASSRHLSDKCMDKNLKILGTLYFEEQLYPQADAVFQRLAKEYPDSPLAGEAYFLIARCGEIAGQEPTIIQTWRKLVYEKYPDSPFAAESYFTIYSYRDYLFGDMAAWKHLQAMPTKYPDSPYLMHAYFLLGMGLKTVRKNETGKVIQKKNLTAAIDAFQSAESLLDTHLKKGTIPAEHLSHYISLHYRAGIERALSNLEIAKESKGAKRQIYLEYAIDLLENTCKELENSQHPLSQALAHGRPFPPLTEECTFHLAEAYLEAKNEASALQVFSKMLENYKTAKITRSYFLSRVHYRLGQIFFRNKEYQKALASYQASEDSSKGNFLSTNQKLDVLIQQSLCYKHLQQLDQSMRILSQVINENAISGERLKAMFLRAEIYELQQRKELSRKQLEALSKKAGEWAQKAKVKLEQEYNNNLR